MSMKKILLLPHLNIHNANALSSPFTIGFPAMTAWLGATHALQRKLAARDFPVTCKATGVVSHHCDLQTYCGAKDYVASIVGTGNPLRKSGQRSSFIEEARCHLDVSLLIGIKGISLPQHRDLQDAVAHILNAEMKMAGGDIRSFRPPEIHVIDEDNEADLRKLTRKLMPGYVLVERRDLMIEAMEQGQDAMDAMLDYLAIHHHCEPGEAEKERGKAEWTSRRKAQKDQPPGWIVPIATGFHGISVLGEAKNQRDPEIPHRFAESLVTLGEFRMPYRFKTVAEMLWRYHMDAANDLYQCVPASVLSQHREDDYN